MRGKTHLILGSLSSLELAILYNIPIGPVGLASVLFCSIVADLDESNSNVMNNIIRKDTTKKIHTLLSYFLAIVLFYYSQKVGKNFYLALGISVIVVTLTTKKFTAGKLRNIFIFIFFFILSLNFFLFDFNLGLVFISSLLSLFPFLKHRKLTHSLIMLLIVYGLVHLVEVQTGIRHLAILSTIAYSSHLVLDLTTKMGIPLFYPFSSKNYSLFPLRVGSLFCNMVENILIVIMAIIFSLSLVSIGPRFK